MVFHDGSLARAPIAPVEVQGYVYDAKLRMAELARRVWHDEAMAARLADEASTLRERFDAAFWLDERGWYALGLDAEKRPIDALGSNMGHLLWSGIVPDHRVAEVAAKLAPYASRRTRSRRGWRGSRSMASVRSVAAGEYASRTAPRSSNPLSRRPGVPSGGLSPGPPGEGRVRPQTRPCRDEARR